MKYLIRSGIFAGLISAQLLYGQEKIDKTVVVVKPYEPTLNGANKINLMPEMSDTMRVAPSFDYSIFPRKITPAISVNPIAPAKMGPEQIARLYKSYLKMGFGLYTTPLFDLNINTLRSQKYTLGIYAHHLSSHGKLKLENDDKVFAGFADNAVSLYGSGWKNNLLFSGNIDFSANTVYHFGYDQSVFPDSLPEFTKGDIRHNMMAIRPSFGIRSLKEDSAKLNFDIQGYYQIASAGTNLMENSFGVKGRFNRLYEGNWLGADLGFAYFKPSQLIDSSYSAIFSFSPWFNRHSDEWTFQLGFSAEADIVGGESKFFLFPKANLQFHVIPYKLIAWFTADGKTNINDQLTVFGENPFVLSSLKIRNSHERYSISGGLRGSLGDFSFNAGAGYSRVEKMHFYVNDSANGWGNYFNVLYDDVFITRLFGELGYNLDEKLTVLAKVSYYQYTLDSLQYAYHKSPLEGSVSVTYNLHDKIIGKFEVFAAGKAFSTSNLNPGILPTREIKPWMDINLGLEYRYTKVLSGFVQFNNLSATHYQQWYNYPVQRFNLMVGFTYAL